jgi:hypothetical protein
MKLATGNEHRKRLTSGARTKTHNKMQNKFFIALQTRFTRIMEVTSLPHLIYWKENLVLSSLSLN